MTPFCPCLDANLSPTMGILVSRRRIFILLSYLTTVSTICGLMDFDFVPLNLPVGENLLTKTLLKIISPGETMPSEVILGWSVDMVDGVESSGELLSCMVLLSCGFWFSGLASLLFSVLFLSSNSLLSLTL